MGACFPLRFFNVVRVTYKRWAVRSPVLSSCGRQLQTFASDFVTSYFESCTSCWKVLPLLC